MPDGTWILGDLFMKDYGHSGSVQNLWEQRWKFPCTKGVYPFHDDKFEDFEPIFKYLAEDNIDDPYDVTYTEAFSTSSAAGQPSSAISLVRQSTAPLTNVIRSYQAASTVPFWSGIEETSYLDENKLIACGLSVGGYYAFRLAHTHALQLIGCVGHGEGTTTLALNRAYTSKYGYASFEEMKVKRQDEFSLISGKGKGVAVVACGMKSCRLLLVNE
ncbi:hypothetical protein J1614_003756 [Plenodomus biglobosus]|nr:hypothetical protein J1614_003756 [Plenodomus biglobosus]